MPIPTSATAEFEPLDLDAILGKKPSTEESAGGDAAGAKGIDQGAAITPYLVEEGKKDNPSWKSEALAQDDPQAAERASILLGQQTEQKVASAQEAAGPHNAVRDMHLGAGEKASLQAAKGRRDEVASTAQTAQDEANTPTALKLPLMAAKGAETALWNTAALAGVHPIGPTIAQQIPAVGGTAGAMTESISQFAVGMYGAGGLVRAGGVLGGLAKGAIADFSVFDAQSGRLSDLVEAHPWLSNPVTEYLASDPNDSEAEGRLKNVLEGGLAGAALETLTAALKGFKKVAVARAAGGDEAGIKAAHEEVAAYEKTLVEPTEPGPGATKTSEAPQGTPEAQSASKATVEQLPEDTAKSLADEVRKALSGEGPVGQKADLNYGKINSPEEVKRVLDGASAALSKDISEAKGGVQTLKETKELADMIGSTPDELFAQISRDAKTAPEQGARLVAAKQRIVGLAQEISKEARAVDQGVTGSERLGALQNELASWLTNVKAVQTGAARATGAGRIAIDPVALKALIASGGDAKAVIGILDRPSVGQRVLNAHNEFYISAILSGPKTHAVNMTSNAFKTLITPAEKIIGGFASLDVGSIREGFSAYMGMAKALQDSTKLAAKSFLIEDSLLDAGHMKTSDASHFAISNDQLGVKAGFDWMGKAVRLSSRFLTSEDEFFKQLNYRADLYARSTRQGMEMGLKGEELANHVETAFEKGLDSTGQGLDAQSLEYARKATFTNELGSFGKDVQAFVGKHQWLRPIVPFVRTPTNIIKEVADRGTLGLLKKSFYSDIAAGGVKRAEALGRTATSSMMMGTAVTLAMNGHMTGRGPKDPDLRKRMMESGWQPYSIKMGDKWVSYQRLEPWGSLLGIVADMGETAGRVGERQYAQLAGNVALAVANGLTSKTYLKGLSDVLDTVSSGDANRWDRFIQNRAASYVGHPRQVLSLLTAGRSDDGVMRDVRSTLDAVMNQIPGLSDNLPPARDFFGHPVHYPIGQGPDSFSPIAVTHDLSDPAREELTKFSHAFSLPAKNLGKSLDMTKYTKAGGQDAYDRFLELRSTYRAGRYTMKERLENLVQSETYKKLPDGTGPYDSAKLKMIQSVVGEYQHGILQKVLGEYPALKSDYLTDKRNQSLVKAKGPSGLQQFIVNQK